MMRLERWRLHAVALALVATVIGAYAAGLRGPFLMDDFDAIFPLAANEAGNLGWWDTLRNAPAHIRGRWASNFSFLLTQAATGSAMPPSAFAYKAGNLLVHLACMLVLGLVAARLARLWGADAARARWAALLAAALFGLHPLLLSTVLYPVQRMAQLATLFVLLAVWAYLRWRERLPQASTRGHVTGIALVLGFTALAVLSKENGALAPLLIGVVELTAFRWPAAGAAWRSRFETGFGLTCAGPLVLGAVLLAVRWPSIVAGYANRDFTLPERLMTQVHVLADYLSQSVWPRIGGMGLYRDDFPVTRVLDPATIGLGLAFGTLIAAAVIWRRRWPAAAFAVLWFFAAHALESSVISLELVFEHRNYLALPGLAIAAAWAITALPPHLAMAVALVLSAGLTVQTARRAQDWRDYDRWIRAEAAHHPGSLRAGSDLVAYLVARRDIAAARQALDRLDREFPDHAQPVIVGLWLACAGDPLRLDGARLARLRMGRIGKDAYHAYVAVRDAKLANGCADLDWASLGAVAEAASRNPAITRQPTAAAAWHRVHAHALARTGDWAGTAQAIESAIAHRGDDPRDWLLLMRARLMLGHLDAYAAARQAFLRLVGNRPGILADEFAELEAAARLPPQSPASPL